MVDRDDTRDPGPTGGGDAKAERLAEALRENLRRRKAQARARTGRTAAGDKDRGPGSKDD